MILNEGDYQEQLYVLQVELRKWQTYVNASGSKNIIIAEGRDGAGKSSCIKTFTEHLNPRSAHIVALDRPTDQELKEWYWTRYIRRFPRSGEICFFDRSYYNRCGVESVMGFATPDQVDDFYRECPALEKMWTRSGFNITKFYFSVARAEQARRFQQRELDPLKLGKLSPIDRVSQSRWDEYTRAKNRMFALTNLKSCPWIVVDSNDKKMGRLNAIRYILHKNDYPGRDLAAIGPLDPNIIKVKL